VTTYLKRRNASLILYFREMGWILSANVVGVIEGGTQATKGRRGKTLL